MPSSPEPAAPPTRRPIRDARARSLTPRLHGHAPKVQVPVRGCTPQWGSGSEAVRRAAEQQVKCHAQLASDPFECMPPSDFWDDAREVELRPGAMLYVPAGMWHRVECSEDSISINVSLMGG